MVSGAVDTKVSASVLYQRIIFRFAIALGIKAMFAADAITRSLSLYNIVGLSIHFVACDDEFSEEEVDVLNGGKCEPTAPYEQYHFHCGGRGDYYSPLCIVVPCACRYGCDNT